MNRLRILVALLLTAALLLLSSCKSPVAEAEPETPAPTQAPPLFSVALDAGHGGIDDGCCGDLGVTEAELNLDIVLRLEAYLEERNVQCILTREDETVFYDKNDPRSRKNQDMIHRGQVIQAALPDMVVSIHMNKYGDAYVNGPQVFYREEDEPSRFLAEILQADLSALPEVQKKRTAVPKGDLFILKVSPSASVLVECGFLSNPREEALLTTESYRQTLAETIGAALIRYHESTQIDNPSQEGEGNEEVPGH